MKKFAFTIVMLSCLAAGCKKQDFVLPDEAFTDLMVESVTANNAWFDVVPANNDFYYMATYLPKAQYDIYGDVWVDTLDSILRTIYDVLTKDEPNPTGFQEACLYKGAFYDPITALQAGTEYVAFGFPYDQDGHPVHKVTKFNFTTPDQPVSHNTFSFKMKGSAATLTPSNNDSFFWDYDSKDNIDKNYVYPSYYYSVVLNYFWEYGFLTEEYLQRGVQESDMSDWYTLKQGDQFYVMVAGYDNGTSTDLTTWVVTYNGPDADASVVPYVKPSAEAARSCVESALRKTVRSRMGKFAGKTRRR